METRLRRVFLLSTFKLWDCLLAFAGLAIAMSVVREDGATIGPVDLVRWPGALVTVGFLLVWHGILAAFKLYVSRRLEIRTRELYDVLRATATGTAVLALAALLLGLKFVTLAFIVVFWSVSTGAILVSRAVMRLLLRVMRTRGRNLRNVIIVGVGRRGFALAQRFIQHPELGYRLVGFVDDCPVDLSCIDAPVVKVLGSLAELPGILTHTVVDEVFFALPMRSFHGQMQTLVAQCEEQGIDIVVLGDVFDVDIARAGIVALGEIQGIRFYSVLEASWRLVVKRLMDVCIATTVLILLSWLMLGIAAAVKVSSPGPVLFRQTRVGLKKRHFTLYKFRTMICDAEDRLKDLEKDNEVDGPVFKIRDDPRVTPLGRSLRRTSIDELPQLFNVLKGDMSLVGPRPLPLRDVGGFRTNWHRRRFCVLPGITCLWQLSGRNNVSFERWMELDREYIDNWSLKLDIHILMRTVKAVLTREGAY